MNDPIAESLGIRPLPEIVEEEKVECTEIEIIPNDNKEVAPASEIAQETLDDVERAQNTIKELMTVGKNAVADIAALAKQSEAPRAYEVMCELIRTVAATSKDYIDVSEKKRYIKEEMGSGSSAKDSKGTQVINNNLVLSTSALMNVLKEAAMKDKG